ncbi:MAG: transposase [Planctomycetes bacterium]|nr:transposase [Planctomycetota bacterium]
MPTLGEVCATYGAAYLDHYGDRVPTGHRRVLQLIADCGTGRLGRVSYRCAQCAAEGRDAVHHTHASCGNRHCPGCQTANNGAWCVEQTKKLLPCEYFFVTFTIPSQLRRFVRSNQAVCYRAMFDAAAFALRTALASERFCGAETIGFTAVLHTFGRDMSYHPHVHVIIPGGGMSDGAWKSTRPGFLVPVKLLSKLFRTEFERLLRAKLCESRLPDAKDFRREFVTDVEAVGDGVATLKYLSRYVFRTAITNDRIVSMHNGQVTFRYRPTRDSSSGESHDRQMTLPVFEFLRRFLQHVLPRRLQKIRHYGFLSRRSNIDLDDVRDAIIESLRDIEPDLELEEWTVPSLRPAEDDGPRCPVCGGPLIFLSFHRIRPPPLNRRDSRPGSTTEHSF